MTTPPGFYIRVHNGYQTNRRKKQRCVTDCLSRSTVQAVHLGMDFVLIAADQQSDPEMQVYRSAISSLKIADVCFANTGVTLMCDVSSGHTRPVVPVQWRRAVFDKVHGLSHPGQKSFTETGLVKVCVAWIEKGCSKLGFSVCGMSTG